MEKYESIFRYTEKRCHAKYIVNDEVAKKTELSKTHIKVLE